MQDNLTLTTNSNLNQYISLTEVGKLIPRINGHRVHPSTVFRWTRGLRGVFLEHWRVGRKIVTTETAVHKFFTELAKVGSAQVQQSHFKHPKPKRRQTPEYRQKSIDEAAAVLRRAKIIV